MELVAVGSTIFFCFLDTNDADGSLSALRLLLSSGLALSACSIEGSPPDVSIWVLSSPLPVSMLLLVESGAGAAAGGVGVSWRTALPPTDVVA